MGTSGADPRHLPTRRSKVLGSYLFTALSPMALLLLILVATLRATASFGCVFTVSATVRLTELLAPVAATAHLGLSFPVLPSSLIVARVTRSRGAQISAFARFLVSTGQQRGLLELWVAFGGAESRRRNDHPANGRDSNEDRSSESLRERRANRVHESPSR